MENGENLIELLDGVTDEKTFLVFLQALADDKFEEDRIAKLHPPAPYSSGARGWEYDDIASFLDAAVACAIDSAAAKNTEVISNPWKRAADIIYGGKVYE